MMRTRIGVLAGVAVLAAAGLGAGVSLAVLGPGGGQPPAGAAAGPAYSWYRSMMERYAGGPMMGGSAPGWMMGEEGYRWMTGGASAPGWMRGSRLPGAMMGSSSDPGKIMGSLWADAPGPRVTPERAAGLGSQVPADASVDRARRTIIIASRSVHLTVVASPAGGPDDTFRIAGMVNPAISVPAGARVSIQVVNADPDSAHGLLVTAGQAAPSWMPMMTAGPAFRGAALWFLGDPTAAGMHTGRLVFSAAVPGSYRYLCPVPGHARQGMAGSFTVRAG